MYQYMYQYGSPAGTFFSTIYSVILMGAFLVAAVEYIFLGIGLYRMAANRNHPSPWMAFIPFARTYLRGELSGDIYLKKHSVKNPGLLLALMPVAYSVIVGCMLLVCFMFVIFGGSVLINGGMDIVIVEALSFTFGIPVLVVSIVYKAATSVLNVLVDYQIYRRYMPLHFAVIHAVLGIFVPLYRGIYLFSVRKRPCYGMGQQQRSAGREGAQTVGNDAAQTAMSSDKMVMPAQSAATSSESAEVLSENTQVPSEAQSVRENETDRAEDAGKEEK